VRKLRGAVSPEARVIIETRLGEECQVDYGTGPMVRDPDSGKYRRTRLFVMMLGYSRKSVRLLVFRSSSRVWAELHEKAFWRLGGTPRIVVLDKRKKTLRNRPTVGSAHSRLPREFLAPVLGSRRSRTWLGPPAIERMRTLRLRPSSEASVANPIRPRKECATHCWHFWYPPPGRRLRMPAR
jgi:hypothetical protein